MTAKRAQATLSCKLSCGCSCCIRCCCCCTPPVAVCCGKWFSLNLAKGVAVVVVLASCPCQSARVAKSLTEIEKYNNLVAKCHLRPTRRLGGMLWFSCTTNSLPPFLTLYTSFSCCHFKSNAKCKSVWVAADLCLCQSLPSRRCRGKGAWHFKLSSTARDRWQL